MQTAKIFTGSHAFTTPNVPFMNDRSITGTLGSTSNAASAFAANVSLSHVTKALAPSTMARAVSSSQSNGFHQTASILISICPDITNHLPHRQQNSRSRSRPLDENPQNRQWTTTHV